MVTRILVIDDDPASRELVRYLLLRDGYDVVLAADGREGLQRAVAERPQLVISDIHLPGLDGMALTAHLRQLPGWSEIPLVAVSGSSSSHDADAAIAAGFDGYIEKPIVPETFAQQIAPYLKA